jgi:hypothetical protein
MWDGSKVRVNREKRPKSSASCILEIGLSITRQPER